MPNKWTGKGNPYTREEVRQRLQRTLSQKKAIIGAGVEVQAGGNRIIEKHLY